MWLTQQSLSAPPFSKLPKEWGLSLPLPEDPPALAALVLRERHLHVRGLLLRADLQDLWGEEGEMPGWGWWPWVSNILPTPALWGGPDSSFPPSLCTTLLPCFEGGANSPPTCL